MTEAIQIAMEDIKNHGLEAKDAQKIYDILQDEINENGPEQCWFRLTKEVLTPDMPAGLHQMLFQRLFEQDDQFSDAPPAWKPDPKTIENANITHLQNEVGVKDYNEFHHWSVTNRQAFWDLIVSHLNIEFRKPFEKIVKFNGNIEQPQWLAKSELNIAESCFKAPGDRQAIVYGEEDGGLGQWSYDDLHTVANQVANGLQALGFEKGQRAAVNMPMTAESVAIYLGIVKAGGAVVSIADSLAPNEVEKRLNIANTDYIFTQDVVPRGGKELPLYEKLKPLEGLPTAIVLPGMDEVKVELREGDLRWHDFLGEEEFEAVPCQPDDYCNILFSSGTTGEPKAIPWTHTTPIKCAADGYLHQDIKESEVVAWPTNIGWMMGPWLIFAALINNASIALYYGVPTDRKFGKFVERTRINMLGLVPGMVKRWLETNCMEGLDWSHIRVYSSTGESSNPQDYLWLMARAGYKPVIEYCGGTEIGGGYFTGTVVQPASPATFSTPALGLDVIILSDEGEPAEQGELFVVPPSIGLSNSLLNKDHHETYYEGVPKPGSDWEGSLGTPLGQETANLNYDPILRRHGDEVKKMPNGYYRAHGRADDTMNIGGIKTSSVEIERLLDLIDGVKETAAIAVEPETGGPNLLVTYAVQQEGVNQDEETLKSAFQDAIKKQLNPLFKVSDVVLTDKLPRTASNKIMRRILRDQYQAS